MKNVVLILALAAPSCAFAQNSRALVSQERGLHTLNIAIEGSQIVMELETPGADIVGFEYEVSTSEDRTNLDAAIAELSKPLSLFILPATAQCTVVKASPGLIDQHHEEEGEDPAYEKAGHTEFRTEYLLNCTEPTAIDKIEFAFFTVFPNAQEVDVQMITRSSVSWS